MLFKWSATSSMLFFFFNDTATTEIYTLSLHDALPISPPHAMMGSHSGGISSPILSFISVTPRYVGMRSEEHTSELQSRQYLVCRLLLEKKNKQGSVKIGRAYA